MGLHSFSPHLHVIEPRGLLAREVAWHRIDQIDEAQARVTRHAWDEAGRSVADWDPRLWGMAATANSRKTPSLSGRALLDESVDAGWRLELSGADGQSVERWDGRGSYSRTDYDECLRPVSVTERAINAQPNVVERYTYGDPSALSAEHNQCGRLIRHDDPAGTWCAQDFGLAGGVLIENRRFLQTVEQPDWPLELSSREALLESGAGYTTTAVFDATATLILQIDAASNRTRYAHSYDGQIRETGLRLGNAESFQALISDLNYNPNGQLESERLGNGVISEKTYEAKSGRLTRIFSSRADGTVLQDLNYRYDPVGNVVEIEDAAQATRFFANQRIDPVSLYRYDTLYQLIEATGREVTTGASHGPTLPALQSVPQDPNQLSNYTQRYDYDAGGNLREMRHVGAQSFTRTMLVAPDSNRSLPEGDVDPDFDKGFDANGNLQQLIRGQDLYWDVRNQLSQINTVKRNDRKNDDEHYVYDGNRQRCRKTHNAQAATRTLLYEVRYLPALEIRTASTGETLNVCTVQAGSHSLRVLHWQAQKPEEIENDQVRYSLTDHLGSSTLELDDTGDLISQESYYPFGGTSWWAARNAVDAKYKTIRYSGKERDATGLYYYGFRYYAPWLMRWLNTDPAGSVDHLNRYCFVSNTPVRKLDAQGMNGVDPNQAATLIQSHVRRFLSPVKVQTPTQGVISVSIKGDSSVFDRVGIALDRQAKAARQLFYLALDSSLQGKVSGGDESIRLSSASSADIANASGSMPTAYINGSYFNMGSPAPNQGIADYASVGENLIDGRHKASIPIPASYVGSYTKVTLQDGSFIHVAPKLTMNRKPSFTRQDSDLERNQYSAETSHVGALGHASDPNARSGISLAAADTAKTRLAMALNPGRGSYARKTDEPGFTMLEWTTVMTRLDALNDSPVNGGPGLAAASSWNLDGGDSSTLGVIDDSGAHVMRVNTLKINSRASRPARPIGNFLSFHRR